MATCTHLNNPVTLEIEVSGTWSLWSKTMEARLQERQIIEYGKINMAKLNLDMGQSRKKGKLLMFQEEQQQESISAG